MILEYVYKHTNQVCFVEGKEILVDKTYMREIREYLNDFGGYLKNKGYTCFLNYVGIGSEENEKQLENCQFVNVIHVKSQNTEESWVYICSPDIYVYILNDNGKTIQRVN